MRLSRTIVRSKTFALCYRKMHIYFIVFVAIVMFKCTLGEGSFAAQLQYIFSGNHSHYVVLPIDALGLANRLRIMASLYAVSLSQDVKLVVVWAQSLDCMILFDEIFHHEHVSVISVTSAGNLFADALRNDVLTVGSQYVSVTIILEGLLCCG